MVLFTLFLLVAVFCMAVAVAVEVKSTLNQLRLRYEWAVFDKQKAEEQRDFYHNLYNGECERLLLVWQRNKEQEQTIKDWKRMARKLRRAMHKKN